MVFCRVTRGFDAACMQSRYAAAFYNTTVAHPVHAVKVVAMIVISAALLLRSARLFVRLNLSTCLAIALYAAASWRFGVARTALCALAMAAVALNVLLWDMPTDNAGHRAGGHAFDSALPENTLEALQHLIRRDNENPLPRLAYVEWDVHETKDGHLVVFHDDTLARAVAESGINIEPAAALRAAGLDLRHATIQHMTLAQLQSFHLGGRIGCHIPTLDEYLSCCTEMGLQRSIAVEVKRIVTDAGRQYLVDAMRNYVETRSSQLEATSPERKYTPFSWAAVISFPHAWAEGFGEFGSEEWRLWATKFQEAGVPVKACVLHWLLLTYGA